QRLTVLLAALCHDLGKPDTHRVRDDGRISFVGHDDAGLPIVDAIAARWKWSARQREDVRRLVGTHLALGFLLHSERAPRDRWRFLRSVEPVAAEAVVLSVGDRLATAGPDDRRRWVRAHLELARTVWADHWREQRDGHPVPLLDGLELTEVAGIRPGPRVGELVRALAEAQAVGDVRDREAAIALVRQLSESTVQQP
ncbi:MAG: polynucleotide adenylyltransferase/metal dependent phosphohydrolase, partial [Thermoleophilia bacterium]|nr:polynucleotide adenylyltransferase/metal dependent phosphohydrolase [Thermoleophilia bacterium]